MLPNSIDRRHPRWVSLRGKSKILIPATSAAADRNGDTDFFEILDSRICDSSQRHIPGEDFQPLFINFYLVDIPKIEEFGLERPSFSPL